ncbi:hypothetical protein [Kribbella monticola]|uniref:hypothetical protein n=1 Tax=Kribbella monticola TaxID=2185285 RepID=UPI000DD48502|nr:hypothetical protein [Kribbella monticola]
MNSTLTKTVAAVLATAALAAAPLSAFAGTTPPTHPSLAEGATSAVSSFRGSLVSVVEVGQVSTAELNAAAEATGFHGTPAARYDVTAYRLVYRTVDHDGRPTTASGLVVLPNGKRGRLTVAEYLHGTMADRSTAPSVDASGPDSLVTALLASTGLVGIAPDYLGLGVGHGLHPYVDTRTEVGASADLLLAARTFAAWHGVGLKRDVLVTGFSQGGRGSLAFGHALSRGEVGHFRLGAIQAVAGPYDLVGTEMPAAFDGRVLPATAAFYLAYLAVAWNRTVGFYDDPAEIFKSPYAGTVEGLFDGSHSYEDIVAGLPDSPEKLFQPAFLDLLEHPAGRYLQALRDAHQVCNWAPPVPVHLYTGTLDTDVAPANATACTARLTRHGAKVSIHSMGAVDHPGTALAAYPLIIREFAKAA